MHTRTKKRKKKEKNGLCLRPIITQSQKLVNFRIMKVTQSQRMLDEDYPY